MLLSIFSAWSSCPFSAKAEDKAIPNRSGYLLLYACGVYPSILVLLN